MQLGAASLPPAYVNCQESNKFSHRMQCDGVSGSDTWEYRKGCLFVF